MRSLPLILSLLPAGMSVPAVLPAPSLGSSFVPTLAPALALTPAFAAPSAPAAAPDGVLVPFHAQLDDKLFADIQHTARKFIAKYPPSEYYYVGIGRSPHAVLGYIEALGLGDVRYTPMSNAKWHFENTDFQSIRTPERERFMKNHIAKVLPGDDELGGRKILIVDFADMGRGIATGVFYASEALFERGFDLARLRAVGFGMNSPDYRRVWRTKEKMEAVTIVTDGYRMYDLDEKGEMLPGETSELFGAMKYGQETDWLAQSSPVGRFDLNTMVKGDDYSEARPEYQSFLAWLRDARRRLGANTVVVNK